MSRRDETHAQVHLRRDLWAQVQSAAEERLLSGTKLLDMLVERALETELERQKTYRPSKEWK